MFKYGCPTILKNKIVQFRGVSSGNNFKNDSVSILKEFKTIFLTSGKWSVSFISGCIFGRFAVSDVVRCFEDTFLYQNRTIRCRRIVQGNAVSSGDNFKNDSVSKMNGFKTIFLTSGKWSDSLLSKNIFGGEYIL